MTNNFWKLTRRNSGLPNNVLTTFSKSINNLNYKIKDPGQAVCLKLSIFIKKVFYQFAVDCRIDVMWSPFKNVLSTLQQKYNYFYILWIDYIPFPLLTLRVAGRLHCTLCKKLLSRTIRYFASTFHSRSCIWFTYLLKSYTLFCLEPEYWFGKNAFFL